MNTDNSILDGKILADMRQRGWHNHGLLFTSALDSELTLTLDSENHEWFTIAYGDASLTGCCPITAMPCANFAFVLLMDSQKMVVLQ